ncbi:MAG: hypothetical protein BWX73_00160 [Lentisphaerae bacterium ADurb.Bin082]|nr:MAG: hypothetical protein BWX73_00160 [Lentisphaerae bacterium ADurb.Bin082]
MIAKMIPAALDFGHYVAGHQAEIPPSPRNHAPENRPEIYRERKLPEIVVRLDSRVIDEQEKHRVAVQAALSQKFALEQPAAAVGVAQQKSLLRLPVAGKSDAVAVAKHVSVRQPHVKPVEGDILDIRMKDFLA